MKRIIFIVSTVVVLSLGTVFGIKSYNIINATSLMGSNLEALTQSGEGTSIAYLGGSGGTCGAYFYWGYVKAIMCNSTYLEIGDWTDNYNDVINWCCDSCPSTWYCGPHS